MFLTTQVSAVLIGYLTASMVVFFLFLPVVVRERDSTGEAG